MLKCALMSTADALESPNTSVQLFLLGTAAIALLGIVFMATGGGAGSFPSEGDEVGFLPSDPECLVLKNRIEIAKGELNIAMSQSYNQIIVGERLRALHHLEIQYKARCEPSYKLTLEEYFKH